MGARSRRPFAVLAVLTCSLAAPVGSPARGLSAAVTTHTPVMGPALLSAEQLAARYTQNHGTNKPRIPARHNDVAVVVEIYLDEGAAEGVRGDIAFVQSMLETGWLSFAGLQIPPDAYNYAGINAFDGRASLPNCRRGDSQPSCCMGTPQHGVLMQMQLLRSYADPATQTMRGRLISGPSDCIGDAPLWEYFGGSNCPCGKLIWASVSDDGLTVIQMYWDALAESGLAGACVLYSPAHSRPDLGARLLGVTK